MVSRLVSSLAYAHLQPGIRCAHLWMVACLCLTLQIFANDRSAIVEADAAYRTHNPSKQLDKLHFLLGSMRTVQSRSIVKDRAPQRAFLNEAPLAFPTPTVFLASGATDQRIHRASRTKPDVTVLLI